jgi:hypothetical protein
VDNTFTGLLNYQDPLNETVEVVTGGDGTANLIFIPKAGFGAYVPTVAASGSLAGVLLLTYSQRHSGIADSHSDRADPQPSGRLAGHNLLRTQ